MKRTVLWTSCALVAVLLVACGREPAKPVTTTTTTQTPTSTTTEQKTTQPAVEPAGQAQH